VPVELDLTAELARTPDRGRLREVFRDFELRDPLRRLEEALEEEGEAETLTAEVERKVSARVRAGVVGDLRKLPPTRRSRSSSGRPTCPRASCCPPTRPGASRRPSPAR
jgi:hypothetical protein